MEEEDPDLQVGINFGVLMSWIICLNFSLTNWTPKLGSKEFVEKELARAFDSWSPYAKLKFVPIDDYHSADIRILFGRYSHGD